MRKVLIIIFLAVFLSGCSEKKVELSVKPTLSVEQVKGYKDKINKILSKKSWQSDQTINYSSINLPKNIENTYYSEILKKSKDSGFDFSKHLGSLVIEETMNIKYNNGDTAGVGHFLFAKDNLVGAYYMVGNYIYSLNEKEVFKKAVVWENIEDIQKKVDYKEMTFTSLPNLIYSARANTENYLFSWENGKLRILSLDKDHLIVKNEISLDGLYVVSMFVNDIDKDKKDELALLVSNNEKWWEKDSKSKLLIYEFGDRLKQKYSLSFEKPMWSIDFDGQNIVVTSEGSIEMYSLEGNTVKKNYAYNKVGGIIKVDDIDGSNIPRYVLRDSKGSDIYVFQKDDDGLEEVWRSYNQKPEYEGMQLADLNDDQVKEIYLQTKTGNMKRIILGEGGFVEKNDVKLGYMFFAGDFNYDGKYEYFDIKKTSKGKNAISYRY